MESNVAQLYLTDVAEQFRDLKRLAERAIAQLSDDQFFTTLDEEANSIAVLMKHVGGNLRSRFTDFLTSDGEKPDRHRDSEFEVGDDTKTTTVECWEEGWQRLFGAIESLTDDDLSKTVFIRREPHSVVKAINRGMTHCAAHVGQIVLLAKHLLGRAITYLTDQTLYNGRRYEDSHYARNSANKSCRSPNRPGKPPTLPAEHRTARRDSSPCRSSRHKTRKAC